jgi:hypothetical protein
VYGGIRVSMRVRMCVSMCNMSVCVCVITVRVSECESVLCFNVRECESACVCVNVIQKVCGNVSQYV